MVDGLKRVYRAVISQNDNEEIPYLVHIPDFEVSTQGRSLFEAIYMARDAIGIMGVDLLEEGKPLPEPYSQRLVHSESNIETLIDIDFESYKANLEKNSHKDC